jgi:uncharacterized lipoprotein YddW (UPF0748 family)
MARVALTSLEQHPNSMIALRLRVGKRVGFMGTKGKGFTVFLLGFLLTIGMLPGQIVVDNDNGAPGYVETGSWSTSSSAGYNGGSYRYVTGTTPTSSATWTPTISEAGRYEVYAAFLHSDNRETAMPFTINHSEGQDVAIISGYTSSIQMGTDYLGEYYFEAGNLGWVRLDNTGGGGSYIADAILFESATDDPPVITNVSTVPSSPFAGQSTFVTALVTDDDTVSGVKLTYELDSSGSQVEVMALDDGNHEDGAAGDGIYGAEIPAQSEGTRADHFFEATDNIDQEATSSPGVFFVLSDEPSEYRSIWADTWNASILNSSQVRDLIDTCRANNINTVMVEIRKIGDAYYASNIEPRATNISGGASFDPLGYLLEYAHDTSGGKKYVHVHGWFVMHRISKGETLSSMHVLSQHPEYIMTDSTGNTVGNSSRYLDPGHPGSVDHNVAVILDCMSNYDIDGVNLDYIRYPEGAGEWGYNPTSIARFNDYYGKTGQPSRSDPDWDDWRRECVTHEVKKLYIKMQQVRKMVVLTADTVNWGYSYSEANYPGSSAYAGVFQDWAGWLDKGIIDYNALMDYTTDIARYQGWNDLSLRHDGKRGSIIGIGAYLNSPTNSMTQLLYSRNSGAAGVNIYDWGAESSTGQTSTFYQKLRTEVFTEWVDPPTPSWKKYPTTGIFEGTVTLDGVPLDHATVEVVGLSGSQTVTDGSGWFGILEVPPGNQILRASWKSEGPKSVYTIMPNAGGLQTVNIELNSTKSDVWKAY